ncbi:hypothetical protein L7F22_067026 [Adiantum nelumboides]|nr:hypothetical protein [Adiantum nelumboides]
MQVRSSIGLAGKLTHKCHEEKIQLDAPKVNQGKEVMLLGEAHSPYLDGVYTLKLNKAALGIAIYNEKGAKLFGMNLVVDRSLFFYAFLSTRKVKIPLICGNQRLVGQDWKGEKMVKECTGAQPLSTKENQEAGVAVSEPLYEVITNEKPLQVSLSQQRKLWLDVMHLLEIEAFPEDPNKRRRWLIRKATSLGTVSFPTFNGVAGEDAQEFLDNLEIACLVTGRDDDATRLRVFQLLMKAEAKVWFNTLLLANRGDWAGLRVLFLAKFGGGGETSESLWGKVCELRQGSLFEYNVYEVQFVELWERWVASLRLGEAAPDFLKMDRFVDGLCPPLREKVKGRFLGTWMDARDIAHLKERKIRYQLQQREADQEEEGMAPVSPTNAPAAHRGQGNQDQQELLSRITHQLEDLSVHLVRGGRGPPPNQEQARGPRRQAQEYHCYNCDENGHGMYYCPHPRRIGNFRGPRNQVSPPRERQQQQPPFPIQQAPPVQILRPPVQPQQQQPPPPPSPIAPIPPLPIPENRAVNVISLDAKVKLEEEEKGKSLPKNKGKAKVEDVDAMPIKRARQEEVAMSEIGGRRKSKENGKSSSKKKSKPRRKLTIKDFALGESSQPYNLVDDVTVQGPKITWPQLLHLAPKVRRQWTKMVSTRRVKTKAMGLASGTQICVMTEQTMHRLGLKVNAPAPCKAKMANNSKVKCLGVINALKIKVCEIEVEVDVYVMPTKGEGYPIILGRPWLMAMQARQDWGTGMLELQPHKGAKKGKAIHIDLRGGKHESLDLETSVDEFSSSDYSTLEEESTITDESDSSQAEIMGVVLTNPTMWIAPLQESNCTMQVRSSIGLAGKLTHKCHEEKIQLDAPKVNQGKEVMLLGEAHSPYLDGVYTLKLNKAALGIAIYNEKGAKLFGMNLVVDRSLFFYAFLSTRKVKIPLICGNQRLVGQDWKGEKMVKECTGAQPLSTKENQEAGVAVSEPLYEVITNEKPLQVSLSQQRKLWLDVMHLLEIEAFPEDPNKRRRWLIRKATRYKNKSKVLLEA